MYKYIMEPATKPFNKRILLGAGVVAAVLAIVSIILVARQTTIPKPGTSPHTSHKLVTPTLQPTIPQTLDDRLKTLEDEAAGIDQTL